MNSNFTKNNTLKIGFDIGSTTAKVAVTDQNNQLLHTDYRRHHTKIYATLLDILNTMPEELKSKFFRVRITGSAGMGVAENTDFFFVQEVVSAVEYVAKMYPEVRTLIDIGGEDSKMIFLSSNRAPDIRMNGSCAGGTGAFIDQTASLLDVSPEEFNFLASRSTKLHPVASRCGVFAKTDIQNLLSRKISKEDIAASVFHAVAVQTLNTLARGYEIVPKVLFSGGPFTFLPELTKTFMRDYNLKDEDVVVDKNPAIISALGAAVYEKGDHNTYTFEELKAKTETGAQRKLTPLDRLQPLFSDESDFEKWKKERKSTQVERKSLSEYSETNCFIGVDSGSTTTKIVVIGENKELLFSFYANNHGKPIETAIEGLNEFKIEIEKAGKENLIKIALTAVTGYGEDLLKAALGFDTGIVETIAHFQGAKHFNPNVSFILDIGGQDMKAIFVENGSISRIELNESCSAGCGSFIETFGKSLGYPVSDFALQACNAKAPSDLGTRCTVFMNSKVKQSLRENADVSDIAAGLSISVIKNALFKVLKLKNISVLGNHISVQGGAFKNLSLWRAMESLTGTKVTSTDIPEQMGAFGAACVAFTEFAEKKTEQTTRFVGLGDLSKALDFQTKQITCRGCENVCLISRFTFNGNEHFYSGNKCEKIFSSRGNQSDKGINLITEKYSLIFDRNNSANINPTLPKMGIPRILSMYENYPFWHTLFSECGFEIELSPLSTLEVYEEGKGSVMSDSICFPAKLAHGHITELLKKGVSRIFYPTVIYEKNEYADSENTYNCPIVSSYAQVIRSSMKIEDAGIRIDSPAINFNDEKLLFEACRQYLKSFGISKKTSRAAFKKALEVSETVKAEIGNRASEIIADAELTGRMLIVLSGRPYHIDPLINQKTPEILIESGCHVISEDMAPKAKQSELSDLQIISQWAYPNRIYNAAQWVAEMPDNFQFVQINSFGCGPDSIITDEAVQILKMKSKNLTLIRVDDISAVGSVRLRLRSMLESLRIKQGIAFAKNAERLKTAEFTPNQKTRTILAPYFAEIYSDLLPVLFQKAGFKLVNLPKPDNDTKQFGLKYANNEICYPATLVVGDVIKALESGHYNRNEIAVGITQTGGQCRASTYLSLIKKAMIETGNEDIPVIAVGTAGKTINPQSGFDVDWAKMLPITFVTMLYADSLAKMYYSTVVREAERGKTKKVLDKWLKKVHEPVLKADTKFIYSLLEQAVDEFNTIPLRTGYFPKIGIVGEIYIKYNSFGHLHVVDWLIEQGIEVVVPPIFDFFVQEFVNIEVSKKENLKRTEISPVYLFFIERAANKHLKKADKRLKKFRFYEPFQSIRVLAKEASRVIDLANQFGEGWLIAAEIIDMAQHGTHHAISLQPFGCIANHVISKGIEKKLKNMLPDLNMLFLDFDDGTTEVNILNRLHFMVNHAKENRPVDFEY